MTVKEIKKEITELKSTDRLHKAVINDIIEEASYYNGNSIERIYMRCSDVSHGCQTGIVGPLIRTSDCVAFFKKYRNEIATLFADLLNECCMQAPSTMFRDWDESDPFVMGSNNQTILAWFAYEEINNRLLSIVEQYER